MPTHPYRGLPADQFWSTAIRPAAAAEFDPVRDAKFTFSATEAVAAAGSCFAQHIARFLEQSGYNYLRAEAPGAPGDPVFSARFGNIYTVRQLRQLLLGAYGLHRPACRVWKRADGRFIDPLRPQLFPVGFASPAEVMDERRRHLAAVRTVFQDCRVFVFTLGLTEAWLAPDGTALPVPPGAVGADAPDGDARYHNFAVAEMREDMAQFLTDITAVNPGVRVILTVSPVPLVATYESRHVLVSNTYSKAALRVVAEDIATAYANVAYFPSYEIITAPHLRGVYFDSDWRGILPAGVAHVMRVFAAHMMRAAPAPPPMQAATAGAPTDSARARQAALAEVLCDEDALDATSRPQP